MSMKIRFQSEEERQNASINCLDISARASMALKRLGIAYINQIQDLSSAELQRIIWPLTLQQQDEIKEALAIWTQQAWVQEQSHVTSSDRRGTGFRPMEREMSKPHGPGPNERR